ncbi:type II secretion system F family protein [Amnibacterium setariae]|uniref:Type II secretion system protein GspF domain-containing protein n=1 Tax=Amnibacterium setariae TaxID=2306585 RepID=A0A3A1TXT2_9MICO|nr:type II secretion system F family protein [Amnibacterium setariae]RIX26519.1 hypothetical protein D1781_16435 [Amnibacterium setariae]
MRRVDPAAEADGVAADLERLRALVGAGATQQAAWAYLATTADPVAAALARGAADAAARGAPLAPAFRDASAAWRSAGAVVGLAAETGAPLAAALRTAATGARRTAELHRAVSASMAGPVASARLVLALPPATALLGWAFGFDVPRVLLSGVGAVLVAVGGALLAGAGLWSRRLVRAARTTSWTTGLGLELVATAVRAGLPVPAARALAADAGSAAGVAVQDDVDEVLAFAARAGLPVVGLLLAEADRVRRAALADARVRAEALAVRLLLPLGLLVLPAFLLLGAVPVGLAVLSSTALPL